MSYTDVADFSRGTRWGHYVLKHKRETNGLYFRIGVQTSLIPDISIDLFLES